jgi:hypothetical protein
MPDDQYIAISFGAPITPEDAKRIANKTRQFVRDQLFDLELSTNRDDLTDVEIEAHVTSGY